MAGIYNADGALRVEVVSGGAGGTSGGATEATLSAIKDQGTTALANLATGYTGINIVGQPITEANPAPIKRAQTTVVFDTITSVANTPNGLLAADNNRTGCRILNYLSSPIYIQKGTGTPPSGAGSDFVPAAYNGEPGQYVFDHRPVGDYRYVCAASGAFTIITW